MKNCLKGKQQRRFNLFYQNSFNYKDYRKRDTYNILSYTDEKEESTLIYKSFEHDATYFESEEKQHQLTTSSCSVNVVYKDPDSRFQI